ncbi:hypothetical protein TNCT_515901 [Trichonephila clavata]|uniref:Uncharacterized protein n=1 Tax=Trichonephila clavata TaxID=2740835 RepID=A0A8X6IYQ7_TRICU|nr:hypothetical protein TNCT_515901 [Trichonephila clavata]
MRGTYDITTKKHEIHLAKRPKCTNFTFKPNTAQKAFTRIRHSLTGNKCPTGDASNANSPTTRHPADGKLHQFNSQASLNIGFLPLRDKKGRKNASPSLC